jgi:putative transposase
MPTVILQTRIFPTKSQCDLLDQTISTVISVCNAISPVIYADRKINRTKFHHTVYGSLKIAFPNVRSQLLVRAIGKVYDAYRTACKRKLTKPICFAKPSIDYDDHIFTVKENSISIGTLEGRIQVPFKRSPFRPFEGLNSNCKLVKSRHNNHYYIYFSKDIPEPEKTEYSGILGVDFGITNLP